jgi:hypothetical protein
VDSAGNADGVGSRFFTIANITSSAHLGSPPTGQYPDASTVFPHLGQPLPDLGVSTSGRLGTVRHADGRFSVRDRLKAEADGIGRIDIHELERLELQVPTAMQPGATYAAYQLVDRRLGRLPHGASFDVHRGLLAWDVAAGFLGPYDLVFLRERSGRPAEITTVRITVRPSDLSY